MLLSVNIHLVAFSSFLETIWWGKCFTMFVLTGWLPPKRVPSALRSLGVLLPAKPWLTSTSKTYETCERPKSDLATIMFYWRPLLGAILAGLFWRVTGEKAAQIIATGLLFLSASLSWVIFLTHDGGVEQITLMRWIDSGTLVGDWAIRLDRLTAG